MSQSRVVHVDCDELAREVRAALLGRDEEEGCAVPLAEIVTLSIKPMDVVPGDYVHRKGKKSLKIVAPPKRMGMVVRLCGVTTDIGHAVDYVEHQLDVMITRGYPVATLPEHDRFGKDQR